MRVVQSQQSSFTLDYQTQTRKIHNIVRALKLLVNSFVKVSSEFQSQTLFPRLIWRNIEFDHDVFPLLFDS